jgi:hypothetical protein
MSVTSLGLTEEVKGFVEIQEESVTTPASNHALKILFIIILSEDAQFLC